MSNNESNKYYHPIVFNEFKLCEMSKDELSMLRLTTLKAISEEFDLQVSGRRKAPTVDCVASFVLYLQGYVRATTQSKSITTVVYMECVKHMLFRL